MKQVITWIVISLSLAVCIVSGFTLIHIVSEDYKLYQQESECVSKYIKRGVERNSIQTYNGCCWIKQR